MSNLASEFVILNFSLVNRWYHRPVLPDTVLLNLTGTVMKLWFMGKYKFLAFPS